MLSVDGRCKTFDARANGYVRAEGISAVALVRDAEDEEPKQVLAATAVRHDGRSASLTAPNATAQRLLITAALECANLPSGMLGSIEAHGTGTPLGDPTEAAGLCGAIERTNCAHCVNVSAAKSNFGHAEPAAGLVGLTKVSCALHSGGAFGNAQLTRLNPLVHAKLKDTRSLNITLLVQQLATRADAAASGLSSFGYSGTIAHAVLLNAAKAQSEKLAWRSTIRLRYRHARFTWTADSEAATGDERQYDWYGIEWAQLQIKTPLRATSQTYPSVHRFAFCARASPLSKEFNRMVACAEYGAEPDGQCCATVFFADGREGSPVVLISAVVGLLLPIVDPIWLMTSGAQAMSSTRDSAVSTSALWGLARGVRCERSTAHVTCVDVNGSNHIDIASMLIAYVRLGSLPLKGGRWKGLHESDAVEIEAMVSHCWWVPRLVQARIPPRKRRGISLDEVCSRLDAALNAEINQLGSLESIDRAFDMLDEVVFRYVRDALQSLGHNPTIPQWQHRWLMEWCQKQPPPTDPPPEPEDILKAHPGLWPEVDLLMACGPYLADALTSTVRYQDLLFPEGSLDLLRPFYREGVLSKFYNKGVVAAAQAIIAQASTTADWRIVEIGAGTGGTATDVLPIVKDSCSVYLFTDVSEVFLLRAKQRFTVEYPFVQYALLNVNVEPSLQGIATSADDRFDLLIATNCLHATPDMLMTMRVCRQLLRPGAIMLIHEHPCTTPLFQITFGLTDGWWLFTDPIRSGYDSPCMPIDIWRTLLHDIGCSNFHVAQGDTQRAKSMSIHSIILAQVDGFLTKDAVQIVEGTVQVITGGLGGLGVLAARLLVQQGAQSVALISRSGRVQVGSESDFELLRANVAQILTPCGDMACGEDVQRLFDGLRGLRVERVLHLAADFVAALLIRQTEVTYVRNLGAKACGGQSLHSGSICASITAFTTFSSYSATLGGIGVATYLAASSLVESLARFRQHNGMNGNCISWGEVGGVGIAARRPGEMTIEGITIMPLALVVSILDRVIVRPVNRLVLGMLIEWSCLEQALPQFSLVAGVKDAMARHIAKQPCAKDTASLASTSEAKASANAMSVINQCVAGARSASEREVRVEGLLLQTITNFIGESSVDASTPLMDAGVDSLSAVELARQLSELVGVKLSSTIMFTFPTARSIARHLLSMTADLSEKPLEPGRVIALATATLAKSAIGRWPGLCTKGSVLSQIKGSCADAMTQVPTKRWHHAHAASFAPDPSCASAGRFGGFVHRITAFDNGAFLISPAEAKCMDPQQRVLLELAYEALHGGGIRRQSLVESLTGVFLGQERPDWPKVRAAQPPGKPSAYVASCDTTSIAAGRISFALDLRGPCESFDTACSSALTGLNSGRRAMQEGECDKALSCSVALKLHPELTMDLASAGMLSIDGRCKTFDASVNGFARSDGVGSIVVLPQDDQCAAAGPVRCSAVQQDGRGASLTAPNGAAQASLLLFVWAGALSALSALSHLEAHGTGTPLGDPTEVGSFFSAALRCHQPLEEPVTMGTVKANMGHTECTSGHVGLICVLAASRSTQQGGNAKLRGCNPLVLECMSEARELAQMPLQSSLAASAAIVSGVSAFGYSGTIVHVAVGIAPLSHSPSCVLKRRAVLTRRCFPWSIAPLISSSHENNTQHAACDISLAVPFLGRALSGQAPGSMVWEQKWSSWETTYLMDHRVGTVPLLPGVSYVEMGRSMVKDLGNVQPYAMTNIIFQNIIFLDDTDLLGTPTIQLRYQRGAGQISITSRRGTSTWVTNAQMDLELGGGERPCVDVNALRQRVGSYKEHVDAIEFYAGTGNDYRGEFRMTEGWRDESDGWGLIEYENTMTEHVHLRTCAWMDVGAHAPIWWSQHEGRPYYSAVVGEYRVHKVDTSLNRSTWVQSHCRDVAEEYALAFFDESGQCVADIQNGRIGFFDHHWIERRHAQQHVYEVRWDSQLEASRSKDSIHVVLVGKAHATCYRAAVIRVESVKRAMVAIVSDRTHNEKSSFQALSALAGCVRFDLPLAGMLVVTLDTQSSSCPCATGSGLWGLMRVARHESPKALWQCFDVAAGCNIRGLLRDYAGTSVVEAIISNISSFGPRLARTVPIAAFVDYMPDLLAMPAQRRRDRIHCEVRSTHVYAGGLTGLGLTTTKWLAQRSHVIVTSLLGRVSHLSELCELDEVTMAHVRVVPSAAYEQSTVCWVLASLVPNLPLHGVWHGHGLVCNQTLSELTSAATRDAFAHRVDAVDLLRAAEPYRLQQSVFFSSAGALLWGSSAKLHGATYHSACSWVDSFASTRRCAGMNALSVQWGVAASEIDEMADPRRCGAGYTVVGISLGLVALKSLLHPHFGSGIAVLPVRWELLLPQGQMQPTLLAGVSPMVASSPSTSARGTSEERAVVTAHQSQALSLLEVMVLVGHCLGGAIDADMPLMEAGLDSLGTLELRNELQHAVGEDVNLPNMLVFDHPTARLLALLLNQSAPEISCWSPKQAPMYDMQSHSVGEVAIKGLSILLPGGGATVRASERVTACGASVVSEVPTSRWATGVLNLDPLEGICVPIEVCRARHGGFVAGAELADHQAFSVSQTEAAAMDPQQRLLLEFGYFSLHGSSLERMLLMGSDAGVFLGITWNEFEDMLKLTPTGSSVFAVTGAKLSVASGRLSYVLGLHGPCVTYDTACSAAVVACHSGLRALQLNECSTGIPLAVNLMLLPGVSTSFAVAGMTSVRGCSHTFDSRADGYARGEACGALVLQCGENSRSLTWEGSAVRHDGRSASLAAPNGQAQRMVLSSALNDATVLANALTCHEAHGTGTGLGDPIETSSFAAAVVETRDPTGLSLPVGGVKANLGHAEAAAGMTALIKLASALSWREVAPNAQLRLTNPIVGGIVSCLACTLPVQLGASIVGKQIAGLSSFGYSGTITSAVLTQAHSTAVESRPALFFRRRWLRWELPTAERASKSLSAMYTVCWSNTPAADGWPPFGISLVLGLLCGATVPVASLPACQSVLAILSGSKSAAFSNHGTLFALTLVQQLTTCGSNLPSLCVLTCGALVSNASDAIASDSAYGAAWGFTRVLRLEHPMLHTCSVDTRQQALTKALLAPSEELEVRWFGSKRLVGRIRVCLSAPHCKVEIAPGLCLITGGLGGLGLLGAALMVESGVHRVLLASRNCRIARDGQGLGALLQRVGAVGTVVACDGADHKSLSALFGVAAPSGVLHAAGSTSRVLLADVEAHSVAWMHAAKAVCAWHLRCARATGPLEAHVLFSSIGAGLGLAGYFSYAAANACLDAQAMSLRGCGMASRSVQWPLIYGAGMGAAALAGLSEGQRTAISGFLGISSNEYTSCLQMQLTRQDGVGLSVQMAHVSDARALLADLADVSQPRFGELVASNDHSVPAARPMVSPAVDCPLSDSIALMSPPQRLVHLEETVLSVVGRLTGAPPASVTAETPLMDVGIDSLAATELARELRTAVGASLPSALVFEQPTVHALVSVVEQQLAAKLLTKASTATHLCDKKLRTHELSHPGTTAIGSALAELRQRGQRPLSPSQSMDSKPLGSAKSEEAATSEMAADSTCNSSSAPHVRLCCLMLHGRAANADVMRLLMTGTDWHGSLSSTVDFMYANAPHPCEPDHQLYASLVQRGLYDQGDDEQYFTFGLGTKGLCVSDTAGSKLIEESVAHVERSLRDTKAPSSAVGGICEGACVAAVVAQRNPWLKLYLNFCGPPWEVLPAVLRDVAESIIVPSVHILGLQDELLTQAELGNLVLKCREATVLRHDQGHVIPLLRPPMARAIETIAFRCLEDNALVGKPLDSAGEPPGSRLRNGAGFSARMEEDEHTEGADDDSLRLTQSNSWANRSAKSVPLDLLTFLATFVVLIHHYRPWGCVRDEVAQHFYQAASKLAGEPKASKWEGLEAMNVTSASVAFEMNTALDLASGRWKSDWQAPVCAPWMELFHRAVGPSIMPLFCVVSGMRTVSESFSSKAALGQAKTLFVIGFVYHYIIPGPLFMGIIKSFSWSKGLLHQDPRMACGETTMVGVEYPWWSWYFFLLAVYKAIDGAWLAFGLPLKYLGLVSLFVFILCAGSNCPYPLCIAKEMETHAQTCDSPFSLAELAENHSPVFKNLTRLWPYYALLRVILPQRFPFEMPLEATARALFERITCLLFAFTKDGRRVETLRATVEKWTPVLVRLGWLQVNMVLIITYDAFRTTPAGWVGAGSYHVMLQRRGAFELLIISTLIMGVGALIPRSMKRTVFSDAGAGALYCYMLHMLACPILHPTTYFLSILKVLLDRLFGSTFGSHGLFRHVLVTRSLRAMGRQLFHEVLLAAYMLALQISLSRRPALPGVLLRLPDELSQAGRGVWRRIQQPQMLALELRLAFQRWQTRLIDMCTRSRWVAHAKWVLPALAIFCTCSIIMNATSSEDAATFVILNATTAKEGRAASPDSDPVEALPDRDPVAGPSNFPAAHVWSLYRSIVPVVIIFSALAYWRRRRVSLPIFVRRAITRAHGYVRGADLQDDALSRV